MRSKCTACMLALSLGVVALPMSAGAQEGTESETSKSESKQSADSDGESSEAQAKSEEGEGSSSKSEKGPEESGETSGSSGDEGKDSSAKEGSSDDKSKGKKSAGEEESSKPKEGPGGREMRSDYPGTDDAMKEQMETERIEGLQFEEGGEPAEAYDVQIQELETKIDDLKEKVFQSKSRVVLLKETVLGGNLSGSRAMIVHSNDLGNKFELRRAMYSLDGNRVFNESAKTGKTVGESKFKVYDGNISAGTHNVSVLLEYRGNGYGVFNYMKGYKFKITSSCQFKAEAGKATVLRVRSVDKAGAFADVERKPGIKCEIETRSLSEEMSEENGGGETKKGSDAGASSEGASSSGSSADGTGEKTSSGAK